MMTKRGVQRQVVKVDVGNSVPVLRNLRVLSHPASPMWPQFTCDFDYTGDKHPEIAIVQVQ
jgi:hypothetical protein